MTEKFQFVWKNVGDGIALRLEQKKILGTRIIPVDQWISTIESNRLFAVGNLLRLLDEEDQTCLLAKQMDDRLWVKHSVIAGLPDANAHALNLPDSTSLVIGLQSRGNISQQDFSITSQWLEGTSVPARRATVEGCILKYGGQVYRIPEPLFSIWHGVIHFNEAAGRNDSTRFAHLATLRELIPDRNDAGVDPDSYIRNTKIMHAAAFSLRLHTGLDGFQVDPVLFARRIKEAWVDTDGEASISEAESLLPEALQEVFSKERFTQWNECRDRYGLGNHYYVYIEPGLQKALTVVRKIQTSDVETRRRFARNPQVYLKEALGDAVDTVDHLFIATEQYSQRVVDLGVWQPVILPWLKREPNNWLPEQFGIQIGDQRIILGPKEIEPARMVVAKAIACGEDTARIAGHDVPANQNTMDALNSLMGFAEPDKGKDDTEPKVKDDEDVPVDKPVPPGKLFLIVDENYEKVSYFRNLHTRVAENIGGIPPSLLTSLMPHQEEGLEWLQSTWRVGFPGVLLADDMGLGKTLLALVFLKWLSSTRVHLGLERLPMMVIAPTGLLSNWKAEHERHLVAPGLGAPLRAYGNELRHLRDNSRRGRDVDLGQPLLDSTRLQEADWILTTFETLRDYHHSFAKVRLAAVVYDESQKIKNPASQISIAAKTVNTDFTLAMTGTPVENRLEDLWAIMDVAYPGYLVDLKTFSGAYPPEDIEALKQLRSIMLDSVGDKPPVMIRRMKADKLKGLPEKIIEPISRPMPRKQADSYAEVVTSAHQASGPGAMLKTLHAMRGVSLHPIHPQQAQADGIPHDEYIAWSARLAVTFEILHKVSAAREKALVFVEHLDMQSLLATMIKREFQLPSLPMLINGAVSGEKRQKAVDDFQKYHGEFNVMILSPKAGGVGLTLTAANHVIHLSRWWNPAVEDQCTDRIYRIGQGRTVKVYYPMAVHPEIGGSSFDIKLNALLERKRAMSRDLLVPPVLAGDESTLFQETIGSTSDHEMPSNDTTLDELDRMTPEQFENWVLHRLQMHGYRSQRTPRSGDGGADGIAVHSQTGEYLIIQCKHRQGHSCDDSPIDALLRARVVYGQEGSRMMAVTTAKVYTLQARERAARHGIELVARDSLRGFPYMAS